MAKNDGPEKMKAMFPLGVSPKPKKASAKKGAAQPKAAEQATPEAGPSIHELKSNCTKEGFAAHLKSASRATLDRYVFEIAGKVPNGGRDDAFVVEAIERWAIGEKNWGNEPPRNTSTNPTTEHTHEEGEMKNTTTTKKNGTTKREIKKSIKVPKEATKTLKEKNGKVAPKVEAKAKNGNGKGMRKPDGKIMLNPWSERTAWFRKAINEAKETKRSDDLLMRDAEKEFGKGNVGSGPWTVSKQRAKVREAKS